MKKMMMFLMVSVFFLMGGMTESMAQKAESKSEPRIVQTPSSILARPGETAKMKFTISGIEWDSFLIYVVVQKPGKGLELLFTISTNGVIYYRNPSIVGRMTVSYDSSSRSGYININGLKVEDTGDYYVMIGKDSPMYFSNGTRLVVNANPLVLNKAAIREVSTSMKK